MFVKKLIFFLIVGLSFNTAYAIEIKDDRDAILKLGMEMSNMRDMLEAYILVGIKLEYKNPTQKLKNGIQHYENLLVALRSKYRDDTDIQKNISISFKAWRVVRKAMILALNDTSLEQMKKGAIFIHGNIRTVIKALANMKRILLTKSNIKDKEILNASIEIAASARRLSAHYMMGLWKLNDPTIEKHWNKGLQIYADSLTTLKHSEYMHDTQFKTLLNSCSRYYRYFTKMGEKPKIYSILIDKKSNKVFQIAKQMTTIILENNHQ